ncbi:MAG: hypothetical protein WB919_13535 [Candidatus Sulfotelmatobacter sp.]
MKFLYTTAFLYTPPRPYLDVVLRNGFKTTKLIALVDSGADYPIFPSEVAGILGIDLKGAPTWPFSGTSGKPQEAKLADLFLSVLHENAADHAFQEVSVKCAFCNDFSLSGLLGQKGLFSIFKTTFHQPENWFEIDPWDSLLRQE